MVSIITASFNRADKLDRLYKSLINQTIKDFEWIIVDDGSTDNTKEKIEEFKNDKEIKIRYYYKENGGKHTALNIGIDQAIGDIIVFLDSDDYLLPNAVEFYRDGFIKIETSSIIGVSGLKVFEDGSTIGDNVEENLLLTYCDFRYKRKIKGDRAEGFKREIIKKYKFPEFNEEKFLTEAVVYNRLSSEGEILWTNTPVMKCEYLENGLTSQGGEIFKNSWKGYSLYVREFIKNKGIPKTYRGRMFLGYIKKSFMYKKKISLK